MNLNNYTPDKNEFSYKHKDTVIQELRNKVNLLSSEIERLKIHNSELQRKLYDSTKHQVGLTTPNNL